MNQRSTICLTITLCLVVRSLPADTKIETVAGTGKVENNGAAGPADEINIYQPFGLEFGPDRALYICEVGHHRVFRLDMTTRRLTTVAGSGRKGYSGDGGAATEAELNEPYEVRFDHGGSMFFVEMRNCVVRRVDQKTGRISTVAGTGHAGYGGDGGPATKAQLRDPHSIAFDQRDRLYIADIGNHRVRRVDLQTGLIETIAGTGEKRLPDDGAKAAGQPIFGPRALFVAGSDLWIALREGNSIWRLNLADGVLDHVAGSGQKGYSGDGGPALAAKFDGPKGIAVSANGDVAIVDTENQAIRVIDHKQRTIQTIAGGGPQAGGYGGDGQAATKARFDRPHGICIGPDDSLYIGDTNNHRVRRITRDASKRRYENRLSRIGNPGPLLADYPQFVQPVEETVRYEAPRLVDDEDGDLHVRAWRFSYNARGIIEMPNRLKAAETAIIMVHPWGIDDGQGWDTPEPAGVADFCTPEKNHLAARHTREVIDPFLKRLRGKAALVLYSLPGDEDPIRHKLYRSFTHRPSAAERREGARELEQKLRGFVYQGEPLASTLELSADTPVIDYFRQFPGLDAGAKFNNEGFWKLPIPITRDIEPADDDVVIYDAQGYKPLKEFLKSQGVRHVLLTGYATDMCFCRTTAGYENLDKDFNVFLVGDATLATFPANATPKHATNAHISFAALNHLITQVSWVKLNGEEREAKP